MDNMDNMAQKPSMSLTGQRHTIIHLNPLDITVNMDNMEALVPVENHVLIHRLSRRCTQELLWHTWLLWLIIHPRSMLPYKTYLVQMICLNLLRNKHQHCMLRLHMEITQQVVRLIIYLVLVPIVLGVLKAVLDSCYLTNAI